MVNQIQEHQSSTTSLVLDSGSMDSMLKLAHLMSSGRSTVPAHLQKNEADCMAVIMQSMQWKMNPYAVAQKTHLVHNTLGYEAQLVNAVITSLAPTKDRLHFEWFGPWQNVVGKFKKMKGANGEYIAPNWSLDDEKGCGVKVWATLRGEDEPRVLELLLSQAQVRNSTLWASDPKQQIAYLGIKRWSRLHTPDVIMGVYTPDELRDSGGTEPPKEREVEGEIVRDFYPQDRFDAKLSQWTQLIKSGEADADRIITKIESMNPMTEEQKNVLFDIKTEEPINATA